MEENDQKTLAKLRELGAKLEPIELPKMPFQALSIILTAEAAAAFDEQGVNPISSLGAGLTKDLGKQISRWHSGKIQAYLGVIAAVFLFLLLILVWLLRLP